MEDFVDTIKTVAQRKHDWKTKEFMEIIHSMIISAVKHDQIHDSVLVVYFRMHKELKQSTTRSQIISVAESISSWLKT